MYVRFLNKSSSTLLQLNFIGARLKPKNCTVIIESGRGLASVNSTLLRRTKKRKQLINQVLTTSLYMSRVGLILRTTCFPQLATSPTPLVVLLKFNYSYITCSDDSEINMGVAAWGTSREPNRVATFHVRT